MELSKSQKKTARELLRKGMLVEMQRAMEQSERILHKWKAGENDHHASFLAMWEHITTFNKHVASRYDGPPAGWKLPFIILEQVNEGVLTKVDLEAFEPEVYEWMTEWLSKSE